MKNTSLLRQEIVPFTVQFTLLIMAAFMGDVLLHHFELIWVGRYLGIPGTILIILSLLYSLRKRKIISSGDPKGLLNLHESLTWIGSLMVIVHAGVYFNVILPWLALIGLVVNVLSGLVGQRLLKRSRVRLMGIEEKYRERGLSKDEVEKEVFWDSVAFDLMAKWRVVHFPISIIFAVFALGHIISVFLFWEWK